MTFATPMCCALFPQKASISVESLEPELKVSIGPTLQTYTHMFSSKLKIIIIIILFLTAG